MQQRESQHRRSDLSSSLLKVFISLTAIFLIVACQNINGERTIYGETPVKERTIEAETICNSFKLPEGSVRLSTNITSKSYLGTVVNRYSTELDCDDVKAFMHQEFTSKGWRFIRSQESGSLLGSDSYLFYSNEMFEIEFSCTQLKNIRGVRRFNIGCHWEQK